MLQYSDKCKYINSFGKSGEGPGEFSELSGFDFVKNQIYLQSRSKIVFFSLEGKLIKENKKPRPSYFMVLNNGNLIENLTDKHIAISLAEKLRKRIEQIYIEEVGHFSCSFGVHCGFIHSFDEILEIFDKADEALYRAKREGKNRVVYL